MKKVIFALIASAAAMGAAQAQGPYVGAGVAAVDHEWGDGWKANGKIFGGYEFDQNWGVEAGYTDIRKSHFNGVTAGLETEGNRSYIAGKYNFPINDKVSLYGKLGVGYSRVTANWSSSNVSGKQSDTEAYGGLGVQYALTPQVALVGEYERYGKKKDFGAKADQFTVGARYSF